MSACLLCGSPRAAHVHTGTDRLYHTTRKLFTVVRCEDCGLLRIDPQPTPAELRDYYPDNYWFSPEENAASRLEELYRRIMLRQHVAFVERALRSTLPGPLLDAGCGGGLFLGLMRERGWPVVGLDISREAAAIAWHRHQVPASCAVLPQAPYPDGSCAALTMFHVLEHLEEPRLHLAAAHRLLRDDGRLVIQVPNSASWQFRIFGSRWNGLDVPRHLFDFRASDIDRLLDECGFTVVRRSFFSLRDNPSGVASSFAPSLDPMARRVRGTVESTSIKIFKDLVYLAIMLAGVPLALAEAAFSAGATVMVEARKQP